MTWASTSGDLAGALPGASAGDSEAALLVAARSDPAAFEALYLRHHRAIWRYLCHRTGETHAADDLVAEVFLDFLRHLSVFRAHGAGVRGWLYRVATRKAARWSNQRRAHESFDDAAHAHGVGRTGIDDAAHAHGVGRTGIDDVAHAPGVWRTGSDDATEDATAHTTDFGHSAADDARDRVRAALNELPQRFQAVLVLHHLEGLGIEEIAASLGARTGTVKSRLARGREALRRSLIRTGDPR